MIALFVIFLGIIPAVGLLALFSFYLRYIQFSWKKPPTPYVANSVSSCWQHVTCACKGVGTVFSKKPSSVPTVSQTVNDNTANIPNSKRSFEIKHSGLVSTTNADGIIRSNTIVDGNIRAKKGEGGNSSDNNKSDSGSRMSFKNIKGLKLNTNLNFFKSNNSSNKVDESSPCTTETYCSPEEKPQIYVKDLSSRFNNHPQC